MVYRGSKSRLKKQLIPIINKVIELSNYKSYLEPFVGGCNIIEDVKCTFRTANDYNSYLIKMVKELVKLNDYELMVFNPDNNWCDKKTYYKFWEHYKKFYNKKLEEMNNYDFITGFVGSLYSFSGGFYNSYGVENESKHYKVKCAWNHLYKQLPKLKGVIFTSFDYLDLNMDHEIVYLDPPYGQTTQYGRIKWDIGKWQDWLNWLENQSLKSIILYSTVDVINSKNWELIYEWKLRHQTSGKDGHYVNEKLYVLKNIEYIKIREKLLEFIKNML